MLVQAARISAGTNSCSSRNARDSSPNDSIVSAGRCANGRAPPTVCMRAMKRPRCSSVARCSSSGARPPCRAKIDEAEIAETMQRAPVDGDRRHGGNLVRVELRDRARALRGSASSLQRAGSIELRDDRRRVVAPDLVDAVLVAVERDHPAIAADADAVERVEHAIGGESCVGRGGRVHSRCKPIATCCDSTWLLHVPRGESSREALAATLADAKRSIDLLLFIPSRRRIPSLMQIPAATERIARQWDDDIVPRLVDYIRIPAKSPHFDPEWEAQRPYRAGDPARGGVGARAADCAA